MAEREAQPSGCVALPESRLVLPRVDLEDVRHLGREELTLELLVLREEAVVTAPDVEREEGRTVVERLDEGVRVRRRAACEWLRSGWVGRVEVAGPRLDDRERARVMQADDRRAVPTRGQADDRPARARTDGAEVRVDVMRKLTGDVVLPVAAGAPVQVLGIGVGVARALREHEDRRPDLRHRVDQPRVAAIAARAR